MSEYILTAKNKGEIDPLFNCPNCGHKTAHKCIELKEPNPKPTLFTDVRNENSRIFKFYCLSCQGFSYLFERSKVETIDKRAIRR